MAFADTSTEASSKRRKLDHPSREQQSTHPDTSNIDQSLPAFLALDRLQKLGKGDKITTFLNGLAKLYEYRAAISQSENIVGQRINETWSTDEHRSLGEYECLHRIQSLNKLLNPRALVNGLVNVYEDGHRGGTENEFEILGRLEKIGNRNETEAFLGGILRVYNDGCSKTTDSVGGSMIYEYMNRIQKLGKIDETKAFLKALVKAFEETIGIEASVTTRDTRESDEASTDAESRAKSGAEKISPRPKPGVQKAPDKLSLFVPQYGNDSEDDEEDLLIEQKPEKGGIKITGGRTIARFNRASRVENSGMTSATGLETGENQNPTKAPPTTAPASSVLQKQHQVEIWKTRPSFIDDATPRTVDTTNWKVTYPLVYRSVPGVMAFCGYRYYYDFFKYIASPAFLPHFANFVVSMQTREGKGVPMFGKINTFISNHWSQKSDLNLAITFGTPLCYIERDQREVHSEQMIAYCVMSVIQVGSIRILEDGITTFKPNELDKITSILGSVCEIDYSSSIHLPRYNGVSFKHANDKAHDERYHRAYQMLRMLWHLISDYPVGCTFKEKWKSFWEQEKLFSKIEVDPEYYAPPWMRKAAS